MLNNKRFLALVILGFVFSWGINTLTQHYANGFFLLHVLLIGVVAFFTVFTLLEVFADWWQE